MLSRGFQACNKKDIHIIVQNEYFYTKLKNKKRNEAFKLLLIIVKQFSYNLCICLKLSSNFTFQNIMTQFVLTFLV